jgi:hypothetical protein
MDFVNAIMNYELPQKQKFPYHLRYCQLANKTLHRLESNNRANLQFTTTYNYVVHAEYLK